MEKTERIGFKGFYLKLSILVILTLFVSFLALSIGTVHIKLDAVTDVLLGKSTVTHFNQIILEIRLPRVLFSLIIGGGLSLAGSVFQAILMNPLAEPYILGISSGGTFGAVFSIVLGLSFIFTQLFALSGAIVVMILVFYLGKRYGDLEPNTLLLSGVMVGAFFSSAILLMIIFLKDSLRTAIFWMVGSLAFAKSDNLLFISILTITISTYLILNSYKYNILSLGNESAKSLGINTKFLKNSTYFSASILVGSLVSVSGVIGFVGLLVPHVCRLIWGIDNRIIIPASFFVGAIYLITADTIARIIISPAEIPVGAITALVGAPVFIYLLRTRFKMN